KKSVNDAVGGFANTHGKGNGYVGKSTAGLLGLRERWADAVNAALADNDSQERIDHRSYADRGIDREAQPKLGAAAWMKTRLGEVRDQMKEFSKVKNRNALRHSLERINSGEAMKEAGQVVKSIEAKAAAVARQLVPDKPPARAYAGSVAPPRSQRRSLDDMMRDIYGDGD
ncbi:MAG: MobA/MobL family protein, partial [Gammaproteobacteria bacterium]